MVYQISYDLVSTTADYTAWYDKLKSLGEAIPALQSTWLLSTELSAEQITDALSPLTKTGDRFLVSRLEVSKYNGWHTRTIWDWIHKRLVQPKQVVGELPSCASSPSES